MIKTSNRQEFSSAFIIPHYADGYEQETRKKKDYLLLRQLKDYFHKLIMIGVQLL